MEMELEVGREFLVVSFILQPLNFVLIITILR